MMITITYTSVCLNAVAAACMCTHWLLTDWQVDYKTSQVYGVTLPTRKQQNTYVHTYQCIEHHNNNNKNEQQRLLFCVLVPTTDTHAYSHYLLIFVHGNKIHLGEKNQVCKDIPVFVALFTCILLLLQWNVRIHSPFVRKSEVWFFKQKQVRSE